MPLSKKAVPELITKFAEAVRAHEMKGSRPPEERDEITHEYREARSELAVQFHVALERIEQLESIVESQKSSRLREKWQDAERRLAEANALLETVCDYVDSHDLAKLGESRVQALIDDHKVKSRFIMQAMLEKRV